ncbi:MAG: hypothetical protein ACLPTM_17175 [Steroidobacteraceae bacterium]
MGTVTVYSFLHFDDDINEDAVSPRKATREAIKRVRGTVIEESGQQVDESELAGSGFYPAKPPKPAVLK